MIFLNCLDVAFNDYMMNLRGVESNSDDDKDRNDIDNTADEDQYSMEFNDQQDMDPINEQDALYSQSNDQQEM
jgi:hypothetical protein